MTYTDRLEAAVANRGNPCLIGLDPHTQLIPEEFAAVHDPSASLAERADAIGDFLCQVIEVAAERVPAVKPQAAFFECFGVDGARAWERVVKAAHAAGLLVIGDVKRGDIGSTAAAYADAYLEGRQGLDPDSLCDAITINPLLGTDSIEPFLESCLRAEKGIYVLVRTSNPSSGEFQGRPAAGVLSVSERIADAVAQWGTRVVGRSGMSSVGAVVGATHPEELIHLRERMPKTPFLLPGYGAQGAGADDIVGGFLAGTRGALVNSSRGILFAYRDRSEGHWKDATRAAIDEMAAEITRALAQGV